ncbi:MAG: hydroxymethylbilane synthase [Lachnospiraceae bacterium]|nr:hydroxymethylbilane synthase [Lachnospiraceae bacterium]
MSEKIIIGSRESRLAVIQSEMVRQYIQKKNPGLEVEILTMKTTGDKILNQSLEKIGGKGLFVKELDAALIDGHSDLSVHSLKDVPMELPDELPLIAYSAREDVRDALILPEGATEIDFSKPVGCSSRRRMLQFAQLFPQAAFAPIRGNVQTRLKKLDSGEFSATILAAAGLKRLGLEHRISRYFTTEEMIPAAGQGILAVQGRKGEDYSYLCGYSDETAAICAKAERAFVRALGGNCSTPVAAYAQVMTSENHLQPNLQPDLQSAVCSGLRPDTQLDTQQILCLNAIYFDEETGKVYRGSRTGSIHSPEKVGEVLAHSFM